MKNEVTASAPGKLMLFGEHAVVYGKPCIVTAVDARIEVIVKKIIKPILSINAPEVGVINYKKDIDKLEKNKKILKGAKFIEFAVKNYRNIYGLTSGLAITTKSSFSSKFGFGSSSAVTVATLKAISELFKKRLSKKQLFDLSYKTILEVQGVGSGFDLASAIWGGTIYFVTGGKNISPINANNLPLMVGYTGVKADTSVLVKKVGEFCKDNKKETDKIFDLMEVVVEDARKAIVKGNYKKVGSLTNINQGLLDSLGVNTKELSDLIIAARNSGAYGAKLSGAGGGDCMICFVNSKRKNIVKNAIIKAGGTILSVKTGAKGVRIER